MEGIVVAAGLDPAASEYEAKRHLLEYGTIRIAARVFALERLRSRASPSQRKAALILIERQSSQLLATLSRLDSDTKFDLCTAMTERHRDLITRGKRADDLGLLHQFGNPTYDAIVTNLVDMANAAGDAERSIADQKATARRLGNNPADVKNAAARLIAQLWTHLGHEPRRSYDSDLKEETGPFLRFAQAIADPLGLGPMDFAVRSAIYGE